MTDRTIFSFSGTVTAEEAKAYLANTHLPDPCLTFLASTPSIQSVHYDAETGWLAVSHDGSVTWDELQAAKCLYMGAFAKAIEVYPASPDVHNKANVRHLWRVADAFELPDLRDMAAGSKERPML